MKILFTTTISTTVNAFLVPHIKMLIDKGHIVDVAFRIDQQVDKRIYDLGCKVYEIPFTRNPLDFDNIKAYSLIKELVLREKYDIVHAHTPVASAVTRLACRKIKNLKIFYTAHGFHFFKGAPLISWLLYYPIEKYLAKYTDVLITINSEDYKTAKKKLHVKNVFYVPGVGIDENRFNPCNFTKQLSNFSIGIPNDAFVVMSVGELNTNKNHDVMLRALKWLNNDNIHYFICGEGELRDKLTKQAFDLGIANQVHLLGYRYDVDELYQLADVFVLPSHREGLSAAVMEAMQSSLPCIVSNIRGNKDQIVDNEGGYLVSPTDVGKFAEKIKNYYENPELIKKHGAFNKDKVSQYSLDLVLEELMKIYETCS